MGSVSQDIATEARERLSALGVHDILLDRIDKTLSSILSDMIRSDVPPEIVSELSTERDRAMFLADLLGERLARIASRLTTLAR